MVEEGTPKVDEVRESFEGFYARELRPVVGLAYVLSGSRSGAEDLAQDGFLAAYRNWARISAYDDPGAWVRRVVANRAVSGFRKNQAESRAIRRIKSERIEFPEIPADSEHIWREVRKLPSRQAQATALFYADQRTIPEIARILKCSESSVKTHLTRAKKTLARSLPVEDLR